GADPGEARATTPWYMVLGPAGAARRVEPDAGPDREILDLKERLSLAEHAARHRGERLAAVEAELAKLRERAGSLESGATTWARELAEELAARDQEIAERRQQIEQLAAEHGGGIER